MHSILPGQTGPPSWAFRYKGTGWALQTNVTVISPVEWITLIPGILAIFWITPFLKGLKIIFNKATLS